MANELTFAEGVTDKVRKILMDSMPEEKIQKALQDEYDRYFTKRESYGSEHTQFSRMIEQEIRNQIGKRVVDSVNEYFRVNNFWDPSEKAKEIIAGIAPAVMDTWIKAATCDIIRTYTQGLMQRQF